MRTFNYSLWLFLCLLTNLSSKGITREDSLSKYDQLDSSEIIISTFSYRTGEQSLGRDAVLRVPEGYRLLDQQQSRVLVEQLWVNPANPNMLGILIPERTAPMSPGFHGFVVSFDPTGYMDEQEVKNINYDGLISNMNTALKKENLVRQQREVALISGATWALPPFYDEAAHALHWPIALHFDGNRLPMLNYEVRLLGRRGNLCITAIGRLGDLTMINEQLKTITGAIHFRPGYSYADFNPHTDKQLSLSSNSSLQIGVPIITLEKLVLWIRSILLTVAVGLAMVFFVYAMQYYHHRRKSGYRNIMPIDERLN
ncbi:DUF2167 domain-containing protein [Chitinophaga sp. 212800010-3]|uniref:DUF2167 domain-containing protein n=1 Tax=unclassified Chitinophaga TaxID=2619133 RepID=UPI002DF661D0|nr:DUF2167 domain-containing protein [Chitinophaga sp. 212800010-3]